MADIVYDYLGGLYLNLTNECPCRCVFCIRDKMDTLGSASEMWHEETPDFDAIVKALDEFENYPRLNEHETLLNEDKSVFSPRFQILIVIYIKARYFIFSFYKPLIQSIPSTT